MFKIEDVKEALGLAHHKADQLLGWQASLYDRLDLILSGINQQNARKNYHRVAQGDLSAADGTCELQFRVPSGGWHLVSIAISGDFPTASTGCLIYRNETSDNVNLLHVVNYGRFASDEFSDGEYVGEGEVIIVRFIGQNAGVRCTANLKYLNLVDIPRLAQT